MGASLAGALRGFRRARIAGSDIREDVCLKALEHGIVDEVSHLAADSIEGAGLVVFCVYAHNIPRLIEKNRSSFAHGSVISDICGVKSGLYAKLRDILPAGSDYVGIHPMAGGERDGFENASPSIYKNSGMIICPLPGTRPESVELMRELAEHIGAARLAVTSPRKHDSIIAYTSDLMHIASAGLCMEYHPELTSAFTAGAFRDCTRVADINADAWTELLLDNRAHTLERLDEYIRSLRKIRDAMAASDENELRALLERAGKNKREMLKR
jgi:prephenate dehydrogenase